MKIIVLTPIKNEEWILDTFIKSCLLFADHIILADQNSSDRSMAIASKYNNVTIIKNESQDFNEGERQKILINTARELFGLGNFLLALDADEIISASSINSRDWKVIKQAELGTVFLFDKPTPLLNLDIALCYPQGFPLAFIDDGSEHFPSLIHSIRIPTPPNKAKIFLHNISFLHLCFARENVQFSKNRYYSTLEKLQKKRNLRIRRMAYSFYSLKDYLQNATIERLNNKWFQLYDEIGISLKEFKEDKYYYMDFEVLKIFNKYGTKLFYNEPIWYFDWESCRLEGIKRGIEGIPLKPIKSPNKVYAFLMDNFFFFLNFITYAKRKFFKKHSLKRIKFDE